MKQLVLGIRPWSMDDGKEGLSVHSIDPELTQEEGFIGIQPLKASIDAENVRKFPELPGVYEMTYKMKPTGKGSLVMKLANAEFIRPYVFEL